MGSRENRMAGQRLPISFVNGDSSSVLLGSFSLVSPCPVRCASDVKENSLCPNLL